MKRPKTLMCYICGREYGTKSLSIHIKQCKEMFLVQENKKPRKDRRNPPSTPPGLMDLLSKDNITLDDISAYNNRAFDKYNYEALVPCQNCGRTFKPESLVHHAKACFPDKPFKPLDRAQAGGEYDDGGGGGQNLVPCSKCGRNFGSDRVGKHESVCKGQQMSSTTANWTKPNETQQTQSQVSSQNQAASQKKIKCFVCNKLFIPVVFKTHPQECATRNNYKDEFPPLAGDLMKLTDPSSLLIELYHRSLNEDLLAPKNSEYNSSANQSTLANKTATSQSVEKISPQTYNNQSIKITKPAEDSGKKQSLDNTLQQSQLKQSQAPQQKMQTNESNSHLQTGGSNYRKVFVPNSQPEETYDDDQDEEDQNAMSGTFGNGLTANMNQKQSQEQYDSHEIIDEEDDLVRCQKCDRKFGADRVDKHQSVCKGQRVSPQKKQPPQALERKDSKSADNPKWKQQHEEFQKVMQYNRKVKEIEEKGGDIRQLGPPPKTNDDHLHQCPYCQRKFDPNRIEKHIGICQNVVNKPKAVPNSNNQIPQASQTQNNFKIRTPQKYPQKQSDNERASDVKQPARTNPNQSYLPPQAYSAKVPTKTSTNFNQNIFQQQQSNQSLLNVKSPQKPRQQKSQDYSNNNSYNGQQSKSANRSGYR